MSQIGRLPVRSLRLNFHKIRLILEQLALYNFRDDFLIYMALYVCW